MRRTLIIMVKEPRPGRVKTRLGREIGHDAAVWWFRHQVRRLLHQIVDPRWEVRLAVSPDRAGLVSRFWPAHLPKVPQGRGDLGVRMLRQMRAARPGPVCVIGADIPGIDRAAIAEGFAALGRHDAVFGPAPDGGYWLVGWHRAGRVPAGFLHGVRWSSPHALADSKASLNGHRIGEIRTLRDVDTAADLAMTRPPLRDSRGP